MRLHRFEDADEVRERCSRAGRSLDEVLARRERIRRQMETVAAAARKHRENSQAPIRINTHA